MRYSRGGGYSGLSPVYAAVNLYKDSVTGDVTTKASQEIGGNTQDNHQIFEITSGLTIGGVDIGKTTGVISTKNLKLDGVDLSGTLKTLNDNLTTQKNNYTSISKVLNTENKTLTGMESVSAKTIEATETLKVGDKEITADKVNGYDGVVTNTGGITRDKKGLGGVSFNRSIIEGLSIASDGSNVFLYTGDWSETSGVNNAGIKISRSTISGKENVEVTIPNLYIDTIGKNQSHSDEKITFDNLKNAVNATDSSEEGSLAYNTQKISYHAASGNVGAYTDVTGDLKITGESGSRAVLSLIDYENRVDITANEMAHMKAATTQIKYNSDNTTSVNGTKFIANDDGTARGVITDYLQIDKDSESYKLNFAQLKSLNNLTQKGENIDTDGKTVITAGLGSVVGKAEFNDKGVIINKDQAQQVIIDENGIKVGKNSSRMNDITGFATSKNLYVGVTNADAPTEETSKFYVDGTDGHLKAANGNFTVDADGAVSVAGGKVKIDSTGRATFGENANDQTFIEGKKITTGYIETNDNTHKSVIGGVEFQNGVITATTINATNYDVDNLTVNTKLQIGTAGNTTLIDGTLQLDNDEDKKLTADKLDNINKTVKAGRVIDAISANIGGVDISAKNITTNDGTITAKTITDGAGEQFSGGKVTATEGKIGSVEITTAGVVTGVSSLSVNGEIKASTFKVDDDNYLNSNGITAKKGGTIGGAIINETTLTVGSTALDKTEGVTTNKLKIGGMTLTDSKLDTGTADFQVNGVTFNQGQVTAHADKGFVAGTSSFKQGSLIVSDNNKLETGNGLTTEKATINGSLDVTGKATFGNAGSQTTIDGNIITTDTLKANKLILGAEGTTTVEVNKDGSFKAANGKFEVSKDGALKAANGAFNIDETGKTTFTKDNDNVSSINGGNIWAKATDVAEHASSEMTHDYKGLHIIGNKAGQNSAFDFDTATGIGTFKGQDGSTTTINGSAVRSAKSDGTAGKLDGENLTLYKDVNNQTTMSAGKVTFKSENAGQYGGTETTIDGGVITTDTLNVKRINLGGEVIDENAAGIQDNSKLYMDDQGNFSARRGDKNSTTEQYSTIENNIAGAGLGHKNADGTRWYSVSVQDKNASLAVKDGSNKLLAGVESTDANGGTTTITGGTSSIEVKDGGITNNGKTTFTGTSGTTTIDGGTIKTGHLITDKLTITGQGNAGGTFGSGSDTGKITLAGDGSFQSNVKVGTQETDLTTDKDGVHAKVTDGTSTAINNVTATSIGGVITNGTVEMAKTELTKDGFKVSQDGYTDVNIANGDVTVNNNRNATTPNQTVKLSDLGSLDNLNEEITSRDEYKQNSTAVGAINSVSGCLTDEVNRLDGRINDVSDRVNKVGAMAAAIASLKTMGYDPQAPSEFSIGLGQYKGETGVAMGFFHYPNKNFMINVSLSTAGGETMGGIGATWRFGHKSPQKLLDEQRAAQAKKELAAAEKYQAAAKLAKEAQERAEYAAKLARQAQVSADNAKAAADATQAKHF